MFDLKEAFATDKQAVEEGSVLKLSKDAHVLVARMPNEGYRRELGRQVERHSAVLDLNTKESEELNEDIMADVLAKTIILGWEGITDGGEKVKFSPETAKKFILKYEDFRKLVTSFATDINNYRAAQEAENKKK